MPNTSSVRQLRTGTLPSDYLQHHSTKRLTLPASLPLRALQGRLRIRGAWQYNSKTGRRQENIWRVSLQRLPWELRPSPHVAGPFAAGWLAAKTFLCYSSWWAGPATGGLHHALPVIFHFTHYFSIPPVYMAPPPLPPPLQARYALHCLTCHLFTWLGTHLPGRTSVDLAPSRSPTTQGLLAYTTACISDSSACNSTFYPPATYRPTHWVVHCCCTSTLLPSRRLCSTSPAGTCFELPPPHFS